MVQGKEASVVEFVVHRIGSGGEESVFNDYSAVLNGEEEQAFLRRFFLKPFSTMGSTDEFSPRRTGSTNPVEAACKRIEDGEELVTCSWTSPTTWRPCAGSTKRGGDLFVVKFTDVEVAGDVYGP